MSVDRNRDIEPPASPTCYADEFAELDIPVDVVQVERRTLAAVHKRATAHSLPDAIADALDRVYAYLESANVRPSGSNVVVYLDDELTIEAGVEVSGEFAADPRSTVISTATPAGTAAHATWFGEYNELAKAHTAVRRWCERHGRTIGLCWERYDDWADDPRQRRTDVYYLLEGGSPETRPIVS
jgi:effector-binding domain-containing protein